MNRQFFAMAVVFFFSVVCIADGLCQQFVPNNMPVVGVANFHGSPIYKNQLIFIILLQSPTITNGTMGVKKITGQVKPGYGNDQNLYEFSLSPFTNGVMCEWHGIGEFSGQYGIYDVTIEKDGSSPQTLSTVPFPSGVIPYPTPKNLRVSFESGLTTPTFSFDPIPGFSPAGIAKYYQIRIYDKDYTRLIYRARFLTTPQVTFPWGRLCPGPECQSTAEDLIPGEKYIFRADVWDNLIAGGFAFNVASSFESFHVPK